MISASFQSSLVATETPSTGLRAGSIITSQKQLIRAIAQGNASGQANQCYQEVTTLSSSGTKTIDLNAFGGAIDALGAAYNWTKLIALMIRNIATDPSNILEIQPGGSNGWTALIGTGSALLLPAGLATNSNQSEVHFYSPIGWVIGASNKTLLLTNQSNSVSLQYQLMALGTN